MRTIQTRVYQFDELSEEAKEKAREWWRGSDELGDWWDYTYDDCVEIAEILGIEIDHHKRTSVSGEPMDGGPRIFHNVSCSQGRDGALFEGHYSYRAGWRKELISHAPKDKELLAIGEALQEAQRAAFWDASARTRQSGRSNHSGCMAVDVDCGWKGHNENVVSIIETTLRDFADWIYAQLKEEYGWVMSDGFINDELRERDYEFYEDGRAVGWEQG